MHLAYLVQPDINPLILQIWGPFAVRWYSLMYVAGFLFSYLFIYFQIKKGIIKVTESELSDIIFYAFLGVIIGGRLGYIIFYNFGYYMQNPQDMIKIWEGGLSFHGAFAGVLISEWIYLKSGKKIYFDYGDIFIVPLPLCLFFGRWGNFVNGELWGRPTSAPWGMLFKTVPQSKWFPVSNPWVHEMMDKAHMKAAAGQELVNLPRHPSQIYEMLLEGLLLFIVMVLASRLKKKPRGLIFSLFFLGYGLARSFVEFFREPDAQLGYLAFGWLTMGMILCIPMIVIGLLGVILSLKADIRNRLWA